MAGSRQALVVLAHPLAGSLCAHLARQAAAALVSAEWSVETLDLYELGFDPVLTATERAAYHSPAYVSDAPPDLFETLRSAELLVLVFPAWWFGLPAILKGFIDRLFAPGVAFDHGVNFGPIRPRLDRLSHVVVAATFGTPWWVDWLVMRRPLRRVLRSAVFATCAPKASFAYLPFYLAENPGADRISRFDGRLRRCLGQLSR